MKNNGTSVKILSSLTQWSLASLFLFPVFPPKVLNVLFMLFCFFVVLCCIYIKPRFAWSHIRHNAILLIPFIPYLVEYVTHTNNRMAGFEFEKKLLFFIAPVVIGLYLSVNKLKDIRIYMYVFVLALFTLTVYSLGMLFHNDMLFSSYGFDNGARLLRHCFEDATNLPPTYYGLFATVAILWLVYDFKSQPAKTKIIYIIVGVLLFFQQLLLAAKMPLIALLLSLFYLFYKTTEYRKNLWIKYASVITLFAAIAFLFPSVKNRIMDAESTFTVDSAKHSIIVERLVILSCDKDIFSNNVWLGIGSRNAQGKLNECFTAKGYADAIPYLFNAHNQFFTLGINYGIFIMLIFITGIISFIVLNRKSPFALVFMLSIVLVMLTESILERQCGVYFYVLFFLILYNQQEQEKVI